MKCSDLEINGGPIRMAPLHLSPTQCAMRVNEGSWQPAMCPHGTIRTLVKSINTMNGVN